MMNHGGVSEVRYNKGKIIMYNGYATIIMLTMLSSRLVRFISVNYILYIEINCVEICSEDRYHPRIHVIVPARHPD